MSTKQDLERNLIVNPDDSTSWLVYSDHLEEIGNSKHAGVVRQLVEAQKNTSKTVLTQLLGQIITKIDVGEDRFLLILATGKKYEFYHSQDCCESVLIEDVCGNLDDLLNTPLCMAEEVINSGIVGKYDESSTWTFYKFATVKGYVTVRWFGTSNGYYSESVDLREVQ